MATLAGLAPPQGIDPALVIDFDLYNAFNSNWPFTLNSNFSTAATSAWLRPTNALQSRFFKVGAQFDF